MKGDFNDEQEISKLHNKTKPNNTVTTVLLVLTMQSITSTNANLCKISIGPNSCNVQWRGEKHTLAEEHQRNRRTNTL